MAEKYFGAGLAAGLLIGVGMYLPGWIGILTASYGALIALVESPKLIKNSVSKTSESKCE